MHQTGQVNLWLTFTRMSGKYLHLLLKIYCSKLSLKNLHENSDSEYDIVDFDYAVLEAEAKIRCKH